MFVLFNIDTIFALQLRDKQLKTKIMDRVTYYHGSSVLTDSDYMLLPPVVTGVIQEKGRRKNLNKVFFTKDKGTANIYAGRSFNVNGGVRRIFRVIPMGVITKINDLTFCCEWAFIEEINN